MSLLLPDGVEIQLQQAFFSELEEMADIFVLAHRDDVTVSNQMKDVPHELVVKYFSHAFESLFKHEQGVEFWKIIEAATGKIIGFTGWHHPSPISAQDHYPAIPAGSNESLCEEFFGNMEAKEKKWFEELGGGENFYLLHFIAILPSYQGKGIGRWAMENKLREADRAGKKAFLIGSPLAQRLYNRVGFEEVDSFDIDLESRGLKGENHWAVMVRQPKKSRGVLGWH